MVNLTPNNFIMVYLLFTKFTELRQLLGHEPSGVDPSVIQAHCPDPVTVIQAHCPDPVTVIQAH